MTSTAAGLKEFGDGDAALFNGSVLQDINSQEDFEVEFHRLLCDETSNSKDNINYITPYDPEQLHFHEQVDALSILEQNSSLLDYFASPPDTLKQSGNDSMKFVEDPLSTHMNANKPTKNTLDPRSCKRGRPKTLRFTTMQYGKTIENTKHHRKFKGIEPDIPVRASELKYRNRQSDSDYYSPTWIRGRGAEREGLCPRCDPSVWFKIKQSAYWYHLNFYHGISAATGKPYTHPISYRFARGDTGTSRVEGHCGKCLQWIFLSNEFEGEHTTESVEWSLCFTTWYKHAQKCHQRTHNFQIPDELCD